MVEKKTREQVRQEALWLMVRRGLLMIVGAIEEYLDFKPEKRTKNR